MRTMFDGITASELPAGAAMVAGYVDGKWPDAPALATRFPHALLVRIAVSASTNAGVVLDVETGDATPEEAVNWVLGRRHAGVDPTVYCSMSTWPAVKAAFQTHDVPQPHYWVALYDGVAQLPAGAVAKQYQTTAGWDESVVADYWPGVDPAPKAAPAPPTSPIHHLEEDDMRIIDAPSTAAANSPRGMWLLGNGKYVYLRSPASYAAIKGSGVPVAVVDFATHVDFLAAWGATVAAA